MAEPRISDKGTCYGRAMVTNLVITLPSQGLNRLVVLILTNWEWPDHFTAKIREV